MARPKKEIKEEIVETVKPEINLDFSKVGSNSDTNNTMEMFNRIQENFDRIKTYLKSL
jgi:hypothetical protein